MWEHVGGGGERWETADKELIAEKKHSGDYVCTVTNLVGPADARLTLNVLYAPIVKVHVSLYVALLETTKLQYNLPDVYVYSRRSIRPKVTMLCYNAMLMLIHQPNQSHGSDRMTR
jgi:hypothetical protein